MKFSIDKMGEFALALLVFLIGIVLPNEVLGHADFFGSVDAPVVTGLALVNFASIDAQSYQEANPGGIRRVLIMLSRKFANPWPTLAGIDADNEVTVAPVLKNAQDKWAEYLFPDGTASLDSDGGGDPGYQSFKHVAELALAGLSKDVRAEIKKHKNAGCVIVMEMKDGQFLVAGSSDDPIFLKSSFKGGKKGNDKRGFTLKGDVDGMMWDLAVLPAALVEDLAIDPVPEPA
ncbi:hypothetical protein [Arsenicibacter rosenii]|uniref:Uncharacterized protein n=1 Tax=Arsenicibacter rosenii TaxID=1750698 RepID=A0A1S2VQY9_9BACT|nr:hypothetical protein [Arsenicibacter rosenii]OIN61182.1 hypothetical protein BLX24_03740 [Arsenicibacter rosenii]